MRDKKINVIDEFFKKEKVKDKESRRTKLKRLRRKLRIGRKKKKEMEQDG